MHPITTDSREMEEADCALAPTGEDEKKKEKAGLSSRDPLLIIELNHGAARPIVKTDPALHVQECKAEGGDSRDMKEPLLRDRCYEH